MSDMNTIKQTIEEVIQAINSVIQVDVTVIDRSYNRIAATGKYVDQIGEKVAQNSVFYKALNTGREFIVESPSKDEVCQDCARQEICQEFAEVCCPIFLDGNVVGIIGLVAFDEFQKNEIISNKMNLLNFLQKMAGLISAKMKEEIVKEQVMTQSKEIEVLFNFIDSAIVSINRLGIVQKCNCKAQQLLNVKNGDLIIDYVDTLRFSKQSYKDRFELKGAKGVERYLYQTRPILIEDKLEQMVITFSKEQDLIEEMGDMINIRQLVTFDDIIGENTGFKKVVEAARRSSLSNSTVLIQGPSGTGKELFARAIHSASNRRSGPFVAINCAAIPESLIESELFGYVEGAFTGALKGGKPGKFEIANKGTIFLDEIGDMPIHLQSKLLRVLQEREVERIGSKYTIPVDVRVIAATHQNLGTLIEQKQFRADLYYRLNVIPIHLTPLKDRLDDVMLLSQYFLARYTKKLDKSILGFHNEVLSFFSAYPWEGNIREMENIIEYAVNMCQGGEIRLSDLPDHLFNQAAITSQDIPILRLDLLERKEIEKALARFPRNKEGISEVTQALGISRATLYRKIKEYNL